ncbi:MAG: DinB family protein [Acidobacteriota bacterium]|nr:DinB family protein [Acidobacteriota bacterium]
MTRVSSGGSSIRGRVVRTVLVASLGLGCFAPTSQGQDLTAESAAVLKAAFLADLEVMRGKFLGLAEAFPQDNYTWRPMEGVRSVSEVLMLIASEGYGFAPMAFGADTAMSREESQGLNEITNKAEVIDHLTKGFAYAQETLEAIDPATLTEARNLFGQERTVPQIALFVGGDMHEHLGQLIAYARSNEIVPPWSQ